MEKMQKQIELEHLYEKILLEILLQQILLWKVSGSTLVLW